MTETGQEPSFIIVFPREPVPGMLSVLVPATRVREMEELEKEDTTKMWRVRALVSDHIPLAGAINDVLTRPIQHLTYLNENPLSIYLESGGRDAIYDDLVADESGLLRYIELQVEARLPSDVLLLARKPFNALLDVFVRTKPMPLAIQRLELLSPRDGGVIAYEMILPFKDGVRIGPLGGISQWPPFAPYDAISREAIISTSPFYQLLCAWRVYDGTNLIRRWMRQQCKRFSVAAPLPSDPIVDQDLLIRMGFVESQARKIQTGHDLMTKLKFERNAIAHFLEKGTQTHVYLADGVALRGYAVGAAALLLYARRTISDLQRFYTQHLETHFMRGSILPTKANRDNFRVRES